MQKIKILLLFFTLTLGFSPSYAQETPLESTYHYIRNPPIISTTEPNTHDDLGTTITVYSLIIGVYVLYWFRQKA